MAGDNKRPTNTERAVFTLLGQTLQFVWRTGAVKIFVYLLLIISITLFAFSYRVSPLLVLIIFVVFCAIILRFLMRLITIAPELFQDSGTWFDYKQFMEGSKDTGLHLPSGQELPVQPIIQNKTIPGKARIVKKQI